MKKLEKNTMLNNISTVYKIGNLRNVLIQETKDYIKTMRGKPTDYIAHHWTFPSRRVLLVIKDQIKWKLHQ